MNQKKPPILLLSQPAGGKTSGLRHINPELAKRTLLINCDNKALPWVGDSSFQHFSAECPTLLPSIIRQAGQSGKFDLIVVDTITIAMSEYTRRFINTTMPKYVKGENGNIKSNQDYISLAGANSKVPGSVDSMGGWGRYAALVSDIVSEAAAANAQVVVMGHLNAKPDEAGDVVYKCPLQGQVGKQGLEGLFSIVMHAMSMPLGELLGEDDLNQNHEYLGTEESSEFTNERYVYQVAHTKDTINTHALRTIEGLWPKGVRFIDNNLQMVFDRFKVVYGE